MGTGSSTSHEPPEHCLENRFSCRHSLLCVPIEPGSVIFQLKNHQYILELFLLLEKEGRIPRAYDANRQRSTMNY
jgi:hypothetical protein